MTAEVLNRGNHRKFIPILKRGEWLEASPSWLAGSLHIDFRRTKAKGGYSLLLRTLHSIRTAPPPLGPAPRLSPKIHLSQVLYGVFCNFQGQRPVGKDWSESVLRCVFDPLRRLGLTQVVTKNLASFTNASTVTPERGAGCTVSLAFALSVPLDATSVGIVVDLLCETYVRALLQHVATLFRDRYERAELTLGLEVLFTYSNPLTISATGLLASGSDALTFAELLGQSQWRALAWVQREGLNARRLKYLVRGDVMAKQPSAST
jgi:hypothetical protein